MSPILTRAAMRAATFRAAARGQRQFSVVNSLREVGRTVEAHAPTPTRSAASKIKHQRPDYMKLLKRAVTTSLFFIPFYIVLGWPYAWFRIANGHIGRLF